MAVKPKFMAPKRAKKAIIEIGKHFAKEFAQGGELFYMNEVEMENYAQQVAAEWRSNPFEPDHPTFMPFAEMLTASYPYQRDCGAIVMWSRDIAKEIYDRILGLQMKWYDTIQEELVIERQRKESEVNHG